MPGDFRLGGLLAIGGKIAAERLGYPVVLLRFGRFAVAGTGRLHAGQLPLLGPA